MAKGKRGGRRAGGGAGLDPADIVSTKDMIVERGVYQKEVDETLQVFSDYYDEYGTVIGQIQLAELKPKAQGVLGFYDGSNIAINQSHFANGAMDEAYKSSVESGWHPSNGNKTALQAVVSHEVGHQLTDAVGAKMGGIDIDSAATRIVNEARPQTSSRGVVQMARKISGYATHTNAEAVAEAVSDVYCNGTKAHRESIAIVNVINGYLKK